MDCPAIPWEWLDSEQSAWALLHLRTLLARGLCPNYHPNYYGAVVTDDDGHNIEAVCYAPE